MKQNSTTPAIRVRQGALALLVIVTLAVSGYRWAGWSWLDALYMVVITVSTVGYREARPMTPGLMAWTMLVIVLGMSAASYTLGGLFQLITQGEIDRVLGVRRMQRTIDQLSDHVVICGFGRIGQMLAAELTRERIAFVVIDSDKQHVEEARQQNLLAVAGDATEEDVLIEAGIERAKSLVTALPQDAANVFITLTSRGLNPGLQIIARGELPSTQKKLIQAGADRVVLPASIGAQRIATMLARPMVVELMEMVDGRQTIDIEIDKLLVCKDSLLVGKTVSEAAPLQRHRLVIVALKHGNERFVLNPNPETQISVGDSMIVMGGSRDIEEFRQRQRLDGGEVATRGAT